MDDVQPGISLDLAIGARVICGMINMFLYAIETTQAVKYFQCYPADARVLKTAVATAFLSDTVGTFSVATWQYVATVTHWGNYSSFKSQHWSLSASGFTSQITTLIVQLFLIRQYRKITDGWSSKIIVSCLVALCLAAFAATTYVFIHLLRYPALSARTYFTVQPPFFVWMLLSALADMGVSTALVYEFRKVRSPFKSTQDIIKRLIIGAVESGTSGSVVALAALICFSTMPDTYVSTGLIMFIGRVYSLTLLHNLNVRKKMNSNRFLETLVISDGSLQVGIAQNISIPEIQVQHSVIRMTDVGEGKDAKNGLRT